MKIDLIQTRQIVYLITKKPLDESRGLINLFGNNKLLYNAIIT